jgi:hypothetical protein
MRLFLDIDTREFLQSPSFPRALTTLALKRRDTDLIELQFIRDRVVQDLPTGTTIRLGLKPANSYTAEFLATGTFTKSGTGTATRYLLDLNLNTVPLNAAFAAATPEPVTLAAMLEVEWTSGTNISSSLTLPVTINNDVIRGDEGEPADLPLFYTSETSDFKASEAEAQGGTDNTKWMSPLRTAQAIAALTPPSVSSWNDLLDKPATFPPETHTHSASEITSGTLDDSRLSAEVTASLALADTALQPAALEIPPISLPVPRVSLAPLPQGTTGLNMVNADGTPGGTLPLLNAPFVTAADLPAPLLAAYPVFLELLILKTRPRAWKAPSPYILDGNGAPTWPFPWPVNHPTRAGLHRVFSNPGTQSPILVSRPNHLPITEPFQTLPAWQTLHGRFGVRSVQYIEDPTTNPVEEQFPVPIQRSSRRLRIDAAGIVYHARSRAWSNLLAPLRIRFRFVLWNPLTTRLHSGPMSSTITLRPTRAPFFRSEQDGLPIAVPNSTWINSPAYFCSMAET